MTRETDTVVLADHKQRIYNKFRSITPVQEFSIEEIKVCGMAKEAVPLYFLPTSSDSVLGSPLLF